jgi:hypothetical protein
LVGDRTAGRAHGLEPNSLPADGGVRGAAGRELALMLLAASPADARKCERGTLAGVVTHVRDGDTIEVDTMPIRLNGLAAPEDEPGGAAATQAMLQLVQDRTLRGNLNGERTHDRCVVVCHLESQTSVRRWSGAVLPATARGSAAGDTGLPRREPPRPAR